MNEATIQDILEAVEGADLCCPEMVTDAVLAVSKAGGDWRAELERAKANDAAERRRLGASLHRMQAEGLRIRGIDLATEAKLHN